MKRYLTEDAVGGKMVVFVDYTGRAYAFDEAAFDEPLTLESVKGADFSNVEGWQNEETTADDIDRWTGAGVGTFEFVEDDYVKVTEF